MAGASKSKNVEFYSNELKTEEFCEWFWKGTNGNELIYYLNNYSRLDKQDDRIRREQTSPTIYCIGLNTDESSNEMLIKPGEMLCKIGLSRLEAKPEHDSRISKIMSLIPGKLKVTPTVIFNMPINYTDIRKDTEVENSIRKKLGTKFSKAKDLNLPAPTEWIWIEDRNRTTVKNAIVNYKEDNVLSTRMFKDLKLS